MSLTTKKRKKKMKRQSKKRGRNGVFAELFKKVNALEELDANFPMMSRSALELIGFSCFAP